MPSVCALCPSCSLRNISFQEPGDDTCVISTPLFLGEGGDVGEVGVDGRALRVEETAPPGFGGSEKLRRWSLFAFGVELSEVASVTGRSRPVAAGLTTSKAVSLVAGEGSAAQMA